jgi:trimeric autotransporter adhesin
MFNARLVAYEPNGNRIGLLPEPLEWSAAFPFNDVGALTMSYSRLGVGGTILDRHLEIGLEIAVEVSTRDGGWVEPVNGRFVLVRADGDQHEEDRIVSYTLPAYSWLLQKARMFNLQNLLPEGHSQAGRRPFLNTNPGAMFNTLMLENRALNGINLSAGFNQTTDAAGRPWETQVSLYLEPGEQYSNLLGSLTEQGFVDWVTQSRSLLLYNIDTELNRTTGVRLRFGVDLAEAPYTQTLEDLASSVLVRSDTGITVLRGNSAAPTPYGGFQEYITPRGVADGQTADWYASKELARRGRTTQQYTRELILQADIVRYWPLVDYRPGDWITAPTNIPHDFVRVQEVVLEKNAEGITGSVVLNDRILDAELRRARRFLGLVGGSSSGSLPGGIPGGSADLRQPAQVQGLVVNTEAFINAQGYPVGMIQAHWNPVTTATDGSVMEIMGYEMWWRRNVDGAPWQAGNVAVHATSAGFEPLPPNEVIQVRVRARGRFTTTPGVWSNPVTITVADDTTPPPAPTMLNMVATAGGFVVTWNGLAHSGGVMPLDFDVVHVYRDGVSGSQGMLRGSGSPVFIPAAPGETARVRGFAVDRSGNRSTPSPWTPIISIPT